MANYVDKDELEKELLDYINRCTFKLNHKGEKKIKQRAKASDKLGKMIYLIVSGLAKKGNWSGYTWNEDMIGEGIITVIKYMHNFTEGKNAHAYISKISQNAFIQYIQKQKKHSQIKDELYDCVLDDEYMEKALDYAQFSSIK